VGERLESQIGGGGTAFPCVPLHFNHVVKVTAAENVQIVYSRNVNFDGIYNSGSIKNRATRFACVMGFSTTADRMMWPLSFVTWSEVTTCNISVCYLSDDNFWKPWRNKFIFAHPMYLQAIRVKFIYEGHRLKVKVMEAKSSKILVTAMKISVAHHSGSIKDWASRFACSFILVCDRHFCHVTGSDHA